MSEIEIPVPGVVELFSKAPYLIHNLYSRNWLAFSVGLQQTSEKEDHVRIGSRRFELKPIGSVRSLEARFFKDCKVGIVEYALSMRPELKKHEESIKEKSKNFIWEYVANSVLSGTPVDREKIKKFKLVTASAAALLLLIAAQQFAYAPLALLMALNTEKLERFKKHPLPQNGGVTLDSEFMEKLRPQKIKGWNSLDELLGAENFQLPIFPQAFDREPVFLFGGVAHTRAWKMVNGAGKLVSFCIANNSYHPVAFGKFDSFAVKYRQLMQEAIDRKLNAAIRFIRTGYEHRAAEIVNKRRHDANSAADYGCFEKDGKIFVYKLIAPSILKTSDDKYIPIPQEIEPSNVSKKIKDVCFRIIENIGKMPKGLPRIGFYIMPDTSGKRFMNEGAGILNYTHNECRFPAHRTNGTLCMTLINDGAYRQMPPRDALDTLQAIIVAGYDPRLLSVPATRLSNFQAIGKEEADKLVAKGDYALVKIGVNSGM